MLDYGMYINIIDMQTVHIFKYPFLTGLYLSAIQLGVALGFLVPPIVVKNGETLEDIGADLSKMFYAGAGYMTFLFLLILICKYHLYIY